jgi:glutamate-1-semialdehyde 2,1-aminomutase
VDGHRITQRFSTLIHGEPVYPGGETRSVSHYDSYPVVLAEGHGALVRDVDGNEYIDVLNNCTSLVHGHGFGPITEAVQAVLPKGTVFPAPTDAQLELASMLTGRYPAAGRVRFTNSGTEASLLAARIVRAATGRRRIVIFGGGYHGSIPEFVDGGGQAATIPYNDFNQADAAIDSSVAAVFAERFLGSGGVILAAPGFLRAIEDRAHAAVASSSSTRCSRCGTRCRARTPSSASNQTRS